MQPDGHCRPLQERTKQHKVMYHAGGEHWPECPYFDTHTECDDLQTDLKELCSTVLSEVEPAMIVAFRRHTLLRLDGRLCSSLNRPEPSSDQDQKFQNPLFYGNIIKHREKHFGMLMVIYFRKQRY